MSHDLFSVRSRPLCRGDAWNNRARCPHCGMNTWTRKAESNTGMLPVTTRVCRTYCKMTDLKPTTQNALPEVPHTKDLSIPPHLIVI